jgi:hypothetical protein
MKMLLTESEIQQVLEQVKTAFPNFSDWEYNNEKNEEYFGFSVWGELVINPEELMPRHFLLHSIKIMKISGKDV